MKILIDGDVVLYLALARSSEATLEDGIDHYKGIIIDTVEAHFGRMEDAEVFLSTDGANFRKNVYPDQYKANRKGKVSPPHMIELKKWALENGGIGSPNGEADDYLLIRAAELDQQDEPWFIATVDKDLRTYPGRFYNLRTQEHLTVSENQAYTFMVQQFVMGDPVDSIPGLPGWGPKKTEKYIHHANTVGENYDIAKEIWRENHKEEDWQTPFDYTCNCAYIRRVGRHLSPLGFSDMSGSDFGALIRLRV